MLSFLNMECPSCGAEYTLSIEELNVMVIFRCFECDQHNMYVAGHMIELDKEIMLQGSDKEKRRHIVEAAQTFALDFAGNVVGNVDRIIDVNTETNMPESGRRRKKLKKTVEEKQIAGPRRSSSTRLVDAPRISAQEVRDFKRIDLELIDKKVFFDRFFGEGDDA